LAEHLAQDLTKQCQIRAISLTNLAMVTALGNDESYDTIFARQLEMYAEQRDLLIVISGSGNSKNICTALSMACRMDIPTLAILGFDGGRVLRSYHPTSVIHVPSMHMGRSEDGHLVVSHILIYGLMESGGMK